jgi:hypothetical protein
MTCCRGTGILSYKIIPAKEVRNTPLAEGLRVYGKIYQEELPVFVPAA